MECTAHYDLLGVRIELRTNSDRIREEARLFLGEHEVPPGQAPVYRLIFEEAGQMPDFGIAGLQSGTQDHCLVESESRTYVSVGEGMAFLDHGNRSGHGYVHPRRNGRWHPGRSVPLLHPLVLRIMFAQGRLPLHAGSVVLGDRLIILAGEKGAGKSTLVSALHQAGCRLVCDDLLYLDTAEPTLHAGGHCQPIKLSPGDAARLPEACRYCAGKAQVGGKELFSARQVAPETFNRRYPVRAVLFIKRSTPGTPAAAWSDRSMEVVYHVLSDPLLAQLQDYHERVLERLCAAPPGALCLVQASPVVEETVEAILNAIE